jgi:capsular polysaccharide transport system permease protein
VTAAATGRVLSNAAAAGRRLMGEASRNSRIVAALLMRELTTRYGRDDIGFLWVIAEPLIFASAVAALWSVARPPFENGIQVIPFTITGYLPLILVRQTINFSVSGVRVNEPLLYHRQITPLHIFMGRFGIEFLGVSLAYVVIALALNFLGLMDPPKDLSMVVEGWLLLAWMAFGLAMTMCALGMLFEFAERIVLVITYILIPLSGAFYMASMLPPVGRRYVMYIPFIHCFEWMRGGFFGESVKIYHNIPYAMGCSAIFTLFGLIMMQAARRRFEVQ